MKENKKETKIIYAEPSSFFPKGVWERAEKEVEKERAEQKKKEQEKEDKNKR